MKIRTEYTTIMLTFVILFAIQLFISGCSTHQTRTTSQQELEPGEDGVLVATQPLINNVDIPKDFYDEIFPDYTRGITIVLTVDDSLETLSPSQLAEIKELFAQSKAAGALHQVHILAWGSNKKNLAQSAAKNIVNVQSAVTSHFDRTSVLVSTYNMDAVPSWASRLLMSKEARMRAYFSRIEKAKMFSKVIIGVSTTDQKTFVHPEMVSL